MSAEPGEHDATDITIASYQDAAAVYLERSRRPSAALTGYLDEFARLTRGGPVLELGSGPGWDAEYLAGLGIHVTLSDATPAFVERLRAAGHDALTLDVRSDPLGGPYRGILADAVLLHLDRIDFARALRACRAAVEPTGTLGITLKEGDGSGWSTTKIDQPRFFTYWQIDDVRAELEAAGWTDIVIERIAGSRETWLFVIARASGPATGGTMGT
ncbi:MAG: methyltransferase domain-containing protein [Pseudolysinimonas sp.]|uniref:methyltransferase domain-containing protein n=1 Tax=Pseudolysinimonas sp. TaxID=2680009 RepID=UPI00326373E0